MSAAPKWQRKYDIIVFGATGFCGNLAAKYIAEKYGSSDLKWAVAGRSQSKVEKVKQECKGIPDIVICDSNDEASIVAAVAQTRVFVTTAGPYSRYGSPVVKACAELGTDYCDITGESDWVREMIALYDDKAKKTGARIVHFCGHDSVPWDMMTLVLTNKLKEQGDDLKRIDMYDELKGGVAGGTLETAFGAMFGAESKKKPKKILDYDPLVKDGEAASANKTINANVGSMESGKDGMPTRSMFFMAPVNFSCVKRSNAINKYGAEITYSEGLAFGGCCGATCFLTGLGMFGCLMAFPPTRCCVQKYCLPQPGDGPKDLTSGYLTVTGIARGAKGGKAEATMKFIGEDPGTQATARMLVESALVLVFEENKLISRGGVLTPAACQGEALMKRLIETGTTLTYK